MKKNETKREEEKETQAFSKNFSKMTRMDDKANAVRS